MNKFPSRSAYRLLVLLFTFIVSTAGADSVVPAWQHPGQQGLFKAGLMSKASSPLRRVLAEYRAHSAQGARAEFEPGDRFLLYAAGKVLVEASATADAGELLGDLQRLGLQNGARHRDMVSGLLPVAAIERAAALPGLRSISAAIAPITNTGSITSQGDTALRAFAGRSSYGVTGSGITVGVLSDSFDILGGAAADVVSGDLPAGVQVLGGESPYCGTYIFCIDEGRAMAQIVYDMAPGVDLLFHTGFATKPEYANAILALASAGADVVVDDLLYLNEPMFQDGVVAQAVDSLRASGVAYFSAAGNAGSKSYQAAFDDSGEIFCIEFFEPIGDCDPIYERVGRMHDFDPGPGVDQYLSVTVPIGGVLSVALQWDQPFGSAGGARNDHDVVLLDENNNVYFEISANDNVTTGEGWEVLQFQNHEFVGWGTSFNLIITYDDVDSIDPPASLLKMVVFGSGSTINEFHTNSSTLYGHANADGATAVAAAFFEYTPAFGVDPPMLEPYSSRGGTPILFATNGSALASQVIRAKPEITAVDGVNTTFFFNDTHGDDGIDDFFGTSAAAPHAAGLAALMLQASPGSTPQQLNTALQNSAIDMNAAGFDHDSGYGLVQADAAIEALLAAGGNLLPVADFGFVANELAVDFTDASSDPDGSIVAWNWDFGDGNVSSAQHPSHGYAAAGIYTVVLTVTDDDGGLDSVSQQVSVSTAGANQPPLAAFSYSCSGRDCAFDSSASSDDSGITGYAWDFGDGSVSDLANPSHVYGANGSYTVTLVVTDGDFASDSASASLRVKNRGNTSGTGGGDTGGGDTGASEKGRKKCTDGLDNDADGLIDGADPDCQ